MPERQLLPFSVGSEVYGLDIHEVREIIIPEQITRVPNMPDFLEGIIDLRGNVVPIVDMRKRFQSSRSHPVGRVLITDVNQSSIGLRVDSMGRVIRIEERFFKPPPAMLTGMGAKFVRSVCERPEAHGGGLILMIDVAKLFSETELSALHSVH